MAKTEELRPSRWLIAPAFMMLFILSITVNPVFADVSGDKQPERSITKSEPSRIVRDSVDASCALTGSIVTSRDVATGTNTLKGLAIISINDVWAVGHYQNDTQGGRPEALIQHWDGQSWTIFPTGQQGYLSDVTAISSNDVWAVGWTTGSSVAIAMHWDGTNWNPVMAQDSSGWFLESIVHVTSTNIWAAGANNGLPLIVHWDGSQWTEVPNPYSGFAYGSLNGIAVVSANDIWAVGYYGDDIYPYWHAATLHWNGTDWGVVPSSGGVLTDVTALSSNDVWTVGNGNTVLHWDGTQWSSRPLPQGSLSSIVGVGPNHVWGVGTDAGGRAMTAVWNGTDWVIFPNDAHQFGAGLLLGVDALSTSSVWADNVWAVGQLGSNGILGPMQTLIMHWDGSEWSMVPGANAKSGYNTLRGVAVTGNDDAWAVGWSDNNTAYDGYGPYAEALIQRWDGQQWRTVSSPNPSYYDDYLYGIDAVAANDVWAVGYQEVDYHTYRTLVMHWDGAQWVVIPSPNTEINYNYLRDVSAVADDAWAVGFYLDSDAITKPLALHWNSSEWQLIPVINYGASSDARLMSVEVISLDDVWAVGNAKNSSGRDETLIVHWDGVQWSRIPSPNFGASPNLLRGVSAVAADDVWAVGYYGPPGTGQALSLHWNGSEWNIVTHPAIGTFSFLQDLDAVSANDVWAVGNYYVEGVPRTLVEHWDGVQWSVTSSPNANSGANYLWDIASVSGNSAWVVGDYTIDGGERTLIERYLPQSFSDVPTTNTFFPYVQCLTCRGILGGYADGTFRPNANVTRGQLSKIIANSAGFSEPVSGQTFQDVPSTNAFYEHVERMAVRGIIGGYECGGVGEPCGTGNKPYFRPNANATRGQISKIVSQARGYKDPVSGQTFEDVSSTNSFYLYIERLAARGIMGGYQCGTLPSEPCGTGNKPYFRWGNNATRGQTSKIVSNTFFPGCLPGD